MLVAKKHRLCNWRKIKNHDGDGPRSRKPSTWLCMLDAGHKGPHKPDPKAHQSHRGVWEHRTSGRLVVQ